MSFMSLSPAALTPADLFTPKERGKEGNKYTQRERSSSSSGRPVYCSEAILQNQNPAACMQPSADSPVQWVGVKKEKGPATLGGPRKTQ